ncbi:MAG: hypothetical protein KDJ75_01435 [Alphaproteobacteria bacterium]|nr:hypothetical protein [Alphaproteobacteria bacterium]
MIFARLKDIAPDNKKTWEDKLFLTFDIDWACDDVLHDTIDLVEKAGVAATWFVTHDTEVLERLRRNPLFELGIHPNFNFLLNGDDRQGKTAKEVVERILNVVPEAKTVRSHSMTQNSNILDIFVDLGLTHDSNHFIPEQINCALAPWHVWNGLIKAPYFWEDDVVCLYEDNTPIIDLKTRPGLKIFDFHPIHVYLNTESLDRYERTRPIHRDIDALRSHRHDGHGSRSSLRQLTGANE